MEGIMIYGTYGKKHVPNHQAEYNYLFHPSQPSEIQHSSHAEVMKHQKSRWISMPSPPIDLWPTHHTPAATALCRGVRPNLSSRTRDHEDFSWFSRNFYMGFVSKRHKQIMDFLDKVMIKS